MKTTSFLRNAIKNVQQIINHDLNILEIDRYRITVKAGSGGAGIQRYNGIGGNGGSVFMQSRNRVAFTDIAKSLGGSMVIKADNGETSQKVKLIGHNGQNVILNVPVGVEVVDENNNFLIGRCTRPNQRVLLAKGGDGGNSRNGYKGQKGEQFIATFHLKLRPNVGLVGFPNAGKSTLLKAFVPKKSVKIAPYPFTTVKPQVGFWNPEKSSAVEPEFTLSLADLPGLIEGASKNRGKGYQFLKHLEYSDILLMVIDVNGFQLSNSLNEPFRNALETVGLLNIELENYDRQLAQKPAVLLLNKMDIARDPQDVQHLKKLLSKEGWHMNLPEEIRPKLPLFFEYVIVTSAKSGEIGEVQTALKRLYRELRPLEVPEEVITKNEKFLV